MTTTTHTTDPGYTQREMEEMAAAAELDHGRFIDGTDEVLHRVGDDVDTLYPASEELEAAGVDIVALAQAAREGLDMRQFGLAIENELELDSFSSMLATDGVAGVNTNLALFNEHKAHCAEHPTVTDRVLALHGE